MTGRGEHDSARARAAELRAAGAQAQRHGRFDAATALFREAIAAAPLDPEGYVLLAGCLLSDRRPEAALQACDAGRRQAGPSPALLCARARILQSLSRVSEAAAAFREALAQDGRCFDARFGLALQAVEAGRWNEAAALVETAGRAADDPALGWLGARIALGRGDLPAAERLARRTLNGRTLPPDQLSETALLLGEALDGLGRSTEAFEAFTLGKATLRALYATRAAAREPETGKYERLADWFRAADPAAWREPAVQVAAPVVRGHVFLIGFPRSGTTLLEQALAGHPDLVALEEAPTLAAADAEFLTSASGLERLARVTAQEAEARREDYWREVAARGVDARGRVFLDKAPAGTLYLPLIAKLFPDARVLFAIRDPRDVVLSCFRSSFQMNALTYAFTDLIEAARCYAACMAMAGVYRTVLPLTLKEVRYERLIDDLEGEMAEIARFIGLEPDPAMTDPAATARRRVIRTPSAPQVRAGLNRQGLARWRAYAEPLAPVMPILAPWIRRFGYEPAPGGGDG
jgi:tetratricopeptide (TPR) repeat protein